MNDIQGIDEARLKLLTEEILELADNAEQKLIEIQLLVNDSKTYFKGDAYTECKNKMETLSNSFPNVKKNIISYAEELNKVKTLYQENKDAITVTIQKNISTIDVNN